MADARNLIFTTQLVTPNEARELLGLEPLKQTKHPILIGGHCPNCGAPKKDSVCEYCGTQFDISQKSEKSELAILQQKLSVLRNDMMANRLYADVIDAMRQYSFER